MLLGGTIRELQARMSFGEYAQWLAYRKKYGPMNDVRRYDRPAALLAQIGTQACGGRGKMKDFMPFGIEEQEATLDDIIRAFKGVNIVKSR